MLFLRKIICLSLFFYSASGFLVMNIMKDFTLYKDVYQKKYKSSNDEQKSYERFEKNLERIKNVNQKTSSYKLGVNQFMDQSMELIEKKLLCNDFSKYMDQEKILVTKTTQEKYFRKNNMKSVDWNKMGFVRRVKNQESCGSCWAFSTVGGLETMIHFNTGLEMELSEQELVDCSVENLGCEGGWMHKALEFVKKNKGLCAAEDYPYQGKKNTCSTLGNKIPQTARFEHVFIRPNSVSALKNAIYINPVCVAVKVDFDFVYYKEGVFDKPVEKNPGINHAVLLTAVDLDKKIWVIKNSWSVQWGQEGFMDVAIRNGSGVAGINSYCVLPIYDGGNYFS